ncbi:glutathione S-transferase family protein [Oceanicella sp. SM1341]|uniref:glutathione S-transferase family protein n=1 Tax=Oceanicella sp. SM1341 TaxID=1548889 RepID=UPI000E4BB181|nr:glutathione S-transferase [Oceanicella sp. SM1341]
MAEYALHCFAQSGNAYKPALMLTLCGAEWEPIFVDFFNGAARGPEYMALNPMAEVPTLQHGALTLSQSGVILDYLTGTLGRFGPETEEERREILRWTLWDNHKLTANIATARFLSNFAPEKARNPDVIAFLTGRWRAAMKVLEAHLASRAWIAAPRPTTADLSCCGYIFYGEEFGFDPAEFPAVAAWAERIRALPGWKHPYDLMPGHPLPG